MNDSERRERSNEILSQPRDYTDEEIQQFLYEFGYETGMMMKPEAMIDLFSGSIKARIFYFSSMIIYINSELHNITLEQRENYIKHLAFIIAEISKDL
ncbi:MULTISPECIES: hypothetical protein [Pseudomonadaceae]|uniref:hypothetical protein n=1 Tax=Pseudomonadaceae TaxID=135621 RepID=UPI001CBF831A|nr:MULTISPECIES: hypothetical protein [Pseudomonas]MBZ3679405.1 hypothetical protein [Pseudomonas aeruginosa]MBZ3690806.1 hypothetical protein [Pseudomonas aeruginosa]